MHILPLNLIFILFYWTLFFSSQFLSVFSSSRRLFSYLTAFAGVACQWSEKKVTRKGKKKTEISFFFVHFSLSVPHTISPHRTHSWWNSFLLFILFRLEYLLFFMVCLSVCVCVASTIRLFVSLWRSIELLSSSPYVYAFIRSTLRSSRRSILLFTTTLTWSSAWSMRTRDSISHTRQRIEGEL